MYPSTRKNFIFEQIVKAYTKIVKKPLGFFFKPHKSLLDFTTSKSNFKKGISKMPTDQPIVKLLTIDIIFSSLKTTKLQKFILYLLINQKIISQEDQFQQQIKKVQISNRIITFQDDLKLSLDYYEPISILGIGSLATIFLVERKDKDQYKVLKSIPKQGIRERIGDLKVRINIDEEQECPFIVQVEGILQTQKYIMFVLKYMSGGDLYTLLSKQGRLLETQALFYFCEIVLALEAIHQQSRIYRDLKLENVLLDNDGHIALTDYGLCKLLSENPEQNPFFGTPEYLAPELFTGGKHSKATDFWCLGILLYEILVGIPPFYNENQTVMFQAIVENEIMFPSSLSLTQNCKDIIGQVQFIWFLHNQLLQKDPQNRLGSNGAYEIKKHPWVSFVNWKDVQNKKVKLIKTNIMQLTSPFINQSRDIQENFDKEFLKSKCLNDNNVLVNCIEAFENLK